MRNKLLILFFLSSGISLSADRMPKSYLIPTDKTELFDGDELSDKGPPTDCTLDDILKKRPPHFKGAVRLWVCNMGQGDSEMFTTGRMIQFLGGKYVGYKLKGDYKIKIGLGTKLFYMYDDPIPRK